MSITWITKSEYTGIFRAGDKDKGFSGLHCAAASDAETAAKALFQLVQDGSAMAGQHISVKIAGVTGATIPDSTTGMSDKKFYFRVTQAAPEEGAALESTVNVTVPAFKGVPSAYANVKAYAEAMKPFIRVYGDDDDVEFLG